MFRNIEMVDGLGNTFRRKVFGRMATEHNKILSILERRARCFRLELQLLQEQEAIEPSIDETGTLSSFKADQRERERKSQARLMEEMAVKDLKDEVLEIHGMVPGKKTEGVIRLLYENSNRFNGRYSNNTKVKKAKELHNKMEADIVAYNEHKLNLKHKLNKIGFNQLFWGGEAKVSSIVVHNIHGGKGRVQEGGTSLLAFGSVIKYLDMSTSGKTESGLKRWVVMMLHGEIRTRIVCAYNPCSIDKPNLGAVYQQQRKYWVEKRHSLANPRVKIWKTYWPCCRSGGMTVTSWWYAWMQMRMYCLVWAE
jgi:hypothetical protein